MPTGYSADLESSNYDLKLWLKEKVIRGMGICVRMRDSGKMSEAEILENLLQEAEESYHTKEFRKAKETLSLFDCSSKNNLQAMFQGEVEKARVYYVKSVKEHSEKRIRHLGCIKMTERMLDKAASSEASEFTVATLQFALDQLRSSFEFDYSSDVYKPKILSQSFEDWMDSSLKDLSWKLKYHSKEITQEQERSSDFASEYKKYVAFIDSAEAQ